MVAFLVTLFIQFECVNSQSIQNLNDKLYSFKEEKSSNHFNVKPMKRVCILRNWWKLHIFLKKKWRSLQTSVRPLLRKQFWFKMFYKGMCMRKFRPWHSCVCTVTLAVCCLKLLDWQKQDKDVYCTQSGNDRWLVRFLKYPY